MNENTDITSARENKPKRQAHNKTGKGLPARKANYDTADREIVKRLLSETLTAYKQPRVTSDDELAERFDQYFSMCAQTGQVPTVEELALSSGYSISTVWDWEMGRRGGFSSSTAEIVRKAKDYLKTFDAKMVVSGKLNFLAYCFRAKNYYGMADKQEVVLTPNNPMGSAESDRALMDRYLDVIDVQDAEQQPE